VVEGGRGSDCPLNAGDVTGEGDFELGEPLMLGVWDTDLVIEGFAVGDFEGLGVKLVERVSEGAAVVEADSEALGDDELNPDGDRVTLAKALREEEDEAAAVGVADAAGVLVAD